MIGYAGLCKLKPLGVAPYFLFQKNWVALWSMLLVFMGGLAVAGLTMGLDKFPISNYDFLVSQGALVGRPYLGIYVSVGLRVAIHRLFVDIDYCGNTLPTVTSSESITATAVYIVVLLLVGGMALYSFLIRKARDDLRSLQFSIIVTASIVLAPHADNYYYLFLLLPFSVLAAQVLRSFYRKPSGELVGDWLSLCGGGVAWFLAGGGIFPLSVYRYLLGGCIGYDIQPALILMNVHTAGGLLLLLILLRLYWKGGQDDRLGV